MKATILALFLLLAGCSYFSQPESTHYEYEETTSLCARVMEYPDRIVILYIDCNKAPETIRRVPHFGASLEED